LEYYIKTGWGFDKICIIELNPPGIYMNTVTSSSSLIEEIPFDNCTYKKENKEIKEKEILKKEKYKNIDDDLGK